MALHFNPFVRCLKIELCLFLQHPNSPNVGCTLDSQKVCTFNFSTRDTKPTLEALLTLLNIFSSKKTHAKMRGSYDFNKQVAYCYYLFFDNFRSGNVSV